METPTKSRPTSAKAKTEVSAIADFLNGLEELLGEFDSDPALEQSPNASAHRRRLDRCRQEIQAIREVVERGGLTPDTAPRVLERVKRVAQLIAALGGAVGGCSKLIQLIKEYLEQGS